MPDVWTPPQATTLPRATVPDGDVRLDNGQLLRRFPAPLPNQTCWAGAADKQGRKLRVIASLEDTPHGELLHVSLSYAHRLPTWEEVKRVRDAFYPVTLDAMLLLPRAQDYVNLHPYVLHLWQTPVGWGLQ